MPAVIFLLEVMDKEPTIVRIWIWFLSLGVVGFAINRFRHQAVFFTTPVIAFFVYFWYSELNDPQVGPDIRAEAGYGYVIQSYFAMVVALVAPLVGAYVRWRRSRS